MKKLKIYAILVVMAIVGFSCSKQDKNSTELKSITQQLKKDSKHQFLKTLRPSQKDIAAVFASKDAQMKIYEFSESRWEIIDNVDENSMKPESDVATLVILSASKDDLLKGETNGISEAYIKMASHLNDDVTMYGIQYLNPDGTEQKKREVFFKVGEKWILIPRAFVAFEQ